MNKTILDIIQLRKSFGGVTAVDALDLSIETESITSVIGPNGAGKTTIFNLVAGFLSPDSGKIVFDDQEVGGKKSYEMAKLGVSRTFQHVQIFQGMSVLENIMVGRHVKSSAGLLLSALMPSFFRKEEIQIRREAEKWLEFAGLSSVAFRPAGELPLGNQRMIEIARALSSEPSLLLLDEPASGLNARETMALGELIQKIKKSRITVMLVEHDMDLVMDISDAVAVINFGKRIACGSPALVRENPDVIAAYLGE